MWLYTSQAPQTIIIWSSEAVTAYLSLVVIKGSESQPFLGTNRPVAVVLCHLRFPFHFIALLLPSASGVKRQSLGNKIWQEWHFLFCSPRFLLWLCRAALACVTDSMNTCTYWFSILCLEYKLECLSAHGVVLSPPESQSAALVEVLCWCSAQCWGYREAQTLENHLHENLTFHHFLPMWASVFYPWNEDIPKAYCEDWMSECILEECLTGGTHLMCISCC